jgi:hypothetical protein
MVKYIIEGGINFYEELYKSFDEPDTTAEETNNLCQITGIPLVERFITLECNHKFNYSALYKEIHKQKFIFNTYTSSTLTDSEQVKFKDAKKDYFIKCPYCRNIQFTLLPYYDDMEHEKRYGINSLEMTQSDSNYLIKLKNNNYSFTSYGYTFSNGTCCKVLGNVDGKDIYCSSKMSSSVVEMNKSFCYQHIRASVRDYKIEQKKKEKEEAREALKKQKEESKEAYTGNKKFGDIGSANYFYKGKDPDTICEFLSNLKSFDKNMDDLSDLYVSLRGSTESGKGNVRIFYWDDNLNQWIINSLWADKAGIKETKDPKTGQLTYS